MPKMFQKNLNIPLIHETNPNRITAILLKTAKHLSHSWKDEKLDNPESWHLLWEPYTDRSPSKGARPPIDTISYILSKTSDHSFPVSPCRYSPQPRKSKFGHSCKPYFDSSPLHLQALQWESATIIAPPTRITTLFSSPQIQSKTTACSQLSSSYHSF